MQQHDISHIARIEYNYKEDEERTGDVLFSIAGDLDHLNNKFIKFRNQSRRNLILISIINLGSNHWVTLVNNKRDGKFYAYYCDSLGNTLQLGQDVSQDKRDLISQINDINTKIDLLDRDEALAIRMREEAVKNGQPYTDNLIDIRNELEALRKKKGNIITRMSMSMTDCIASALMETLEVTSDDIKSFQVQQQKDSHNCGIFAIDNGKKIVDMLMEGKSFDEMNKLLSQDIPNPEDLINKRKYFSQNLLNDSERKEFVISNFAVVQGLDIHNINHLKLLLKSAIERKYFNIAVLAVEKGASTEGISDVQKRELLNYIEIHHPEVIQGNRDIISLLSTSEPVNPSESDQQPPRSGLEGANNEPMDFDQATQKNKSNKRANEKRSDSEPQLEPSNANQESSQPDSHQSGSTQRPETSSQVYRTDISIEERIRARKISINNRKLLVAAGTGNANSGLKRE